MFCKKGVLRNFTKFTGKHLCQSLLFNKVTGLRLATLLKKRLWHRCFPVNIVEFLRTTFYLDNLWWLLLFMIFSVLVLFVIGISLSILSNKTFLTFWLNPYSIAINYMRLCWFSRMPLSVPKQSAKGVL